jgi:hypothetical protein
VELLHAEVQRVKDEPSADEKGTEKDQCRGEDARRLRQVDRRGQTEHQRDAETYEAEAAEEGQRLVRTEQVKDLESDREAIAVRAELREAALRSRTVFDVHLGDRHVVEERLDRHLGLDLETTRHDGQNPRDLRCEGPVAREHVGQARAPDEADDPAEDDVACVVEAPKRAGLGAPQSRAHDHVTGAIEHRLDEVRDLVRWIRRVRIEHDVDVGLDLLEHCSHDVALTQPANPNNADALLRSDSRRTIGAVVVEDNDRGIGTARPHIIDDGANRRLFVEARQKYRYAPRVRLRASRGKMASDDSCILDVDHAASGDTPPSPAPCAASAKWFVRPEKFSRGYRCR